jgi:MEMO1 family protein
MNRRIRTLARGWYPAGSTECLREIETFVDAWNPPRLSGDGFGGIVPHAGWTFSGKLAARVFYTLGSHRKADVVVLFGGHLGRKDLPHIVTEDCWETPFGDMAIDVNFATTLLGRLDMKKESPASGDNTMEVQLPLIKHFFPEAKLVAVRSPHSDRAVELGEEVVRIAREKGISIVAFGSTDLTHYGPNYGFTVKGVGPPSVEWVKKENDQRFIHEALKMDAGGLLSDAAEHSSACSAGGAASTVTTCTLLGATKGILIEHCTSYDLLPDQSFVGYAGIVY